MEPADSPQVPSEPVHGEVVEGGEVAEVRHLPVPFEGAHTDLEPRRPVSVPATVVAATGGFVLGIAAFLLVKVLRRPSAGRALSRRRARVLARRRGVDVQATKSFLVDVHLLKR